MINVLYRPLLAVVCSLCVVLGSVPAFGQKFLPQEIIEAETITADMIAQIDAVVETAMRVLIGETPKPEDVTEAREQLQQLFRANDPSAAYLESLSAAISGRMQGVAQHESTLVRINAMIVLTEMIDDGSKQWIDAGLKDESHAVKRWAAEALGRRMLWWQSRLTSGADRSAQTKIDEAIKQIDALVDQAEPPHPIVVGSGLKALYQVSTPLSRETLIRLLSKRVAIHVAEPGLSYNAERLVIESFSNTLVVEVPTDMRSIKGLSQAMVRYASLIVDQSQANQVSKEQQADTKTMLFNCLQGMASVSVAAKASNAPPADHAQAKNWVVNDRWDELKGLIKKDWAAVYAADPFRFKPDDLKP